jgi:hypothetical protein
VSYDYFLNSREFKVRKGRFFCRKKESKSYDKKIGPCGVRSKWDLGGLGKGRNPNPKVKTMEIEIYGIS